MRNVNRANNRDSLSLDFDFFSVLSFCRIRSINSAIFRVLVDRLLNNKTAIQPPSIRVITFRFEFQSISTSHTLDVDEIQAIESSDLFRSTYDSLAGSHNTNNRSTSKCDEIKYISNLINSHCHTHITHFNRSRMSFKRETLARALYCLLEHNIS